MRILLVNWAKIWEGARSGGGVGGYCHDLALELRRRGHEVSYIFSGHTYVPRPFSRGIGEPRVRRIPDYEGLRVFEIVNAPCVAPAFFQFREPFAEASSPTLEAEFARFLGVLKPEIVHFNNAEGFSAGCVNVASRHAAAVFSLHNYHTLCPQVNLMRDNRRVCTDYENGHACVTCVNGPSPRAEREHRAMAYRRGFDALHPFVTAEGLRGPGRSGGLRAVRAWLNRGTVGEALSLLSDPPGYPYPGRPVATLADLTIDGRRPPRSDRASDVAAITPDDPAYAPVDNIPPPPQPKSAYPGKPENDYARRRAAMLAALGACRRVHAVSDFVRDLFAGHGVPRERIESLTIGSRMADLAAEQRAFLVTPPPASTGRPIRLAFIGYHNFFKGLHMLADVLDALPDATVSRFHLTVVALDADTIEPRFRRMQPRLAGLLYGYGYRYDEVPRLVAGHDLGVVPSVWWDNGPQTVMEFHACGIPVLAASLGGIPTLVRDGVDGMLFRGNDRAALSTALTRLAEDPAVIDALRRNVRPPKNMATHATEMEALYARAVELPTEAAAT